MVGDIIRTISIVETGVTDTADDKKFLRTQGQFSKESDIGLGSLTLLVVVVDTETLQFSNKSTANILVTGNRAIP